jgi:hypothetical protein
MEELAAARATRGARAFLDPSAAPGSEGHPVIDAGERQSTASQSGHRDTSLARTEGTPIETSTETRRVVWCIRGTARHRTEPIVPMSGSASCA